MNKATANESMSTSGSASSRTQASLDSFQPPGEKQLLPRLAMSARTPSLDSSLAASSGKDEEFWTSLVQVCMIQCGVNIVSLLGVALTTELWRKCHGRRGVPQPTSSRREQQVQALLNGDLSCLDSFDLSRKRSNQPSASFESGSTGPVSRYPEYEHHRAVTKPVHARRERAVDDHSNASSATSSVKSAKTKLTIVKDPDYLRFRKRMQAAKRHGRPPSDRVNPRSPDCHPKGGKRCLRTGGFSDGLREEKLLGQVKGLIGTVIGKSPPSSSPFYFTRANSSAESSFVEFSDTESVEIVFD